MRLVQRSGEAVDGERGAREAGPKGPRARGLAKHGHSEHAVRRTAEDRVKPASTSRQRGVGLGLLLLVDRRRVLGGGGGDEDERGEERVPDFVHPRILAAGPALCTPEDVRLAHAP